MKNVDITERLSQKEINEISAALCNARCELEELSQRMEEEEIETLLEIDCGDFDKDGIQDIADIISTIEDWFFTHSSANK